MNLNLVVLTAGKWEGKEIPITLSQFLIGRDPECNLRPASALISKRHCLLLIRAGQVLVRDFKSTNGTYVNEERVDGERALENGDHLRVGPLLFRVDVEVSTPVDKPTPRPSTKAEAAARDEEAAADLLLSLQDSGDSNSSAGEQQDVSAGSTVMDALNSPTSEETAAAGSEKPADKKPAESKKPSGDTSTAAKAILEKYIRRPRP